MHPLDRPPQFPPPLCPNPEKRGKKKFRGRMGSGGGIGAAATTTTFFLLLFSLAASMNQDQQALSIDRQDLEIGIGIGIGGNGSAECVCDVPPPPPLPPKFCRQPPPPPPCPPSSPPPPALPEELIQARKAIQKLKYFLEDDPNNITKTWVGSDPCKYQGFFCAAPPRNPKTKAVAAVDFNRYNLMFKVGALDVLAGLKDIAIFHANSNRFKGTVPAELAKLRYIYELDLSNNLLSGPFPQLASIDQLLFFDIRFNQFSGMVPATIFRNKLDVLFLNNDRFCGPLPDAIGNSPVSVLSLANNYFTGNIPATIKNMSETLIQVLFLNNKLSGCLRPEIGYLKNATVFDAGGNSLTGPIPITFGCLHKVEQLNLAVNKLYGEIPEALCKLPNLKNLSLSSNFLTWEGPACRKLAETGKLHDQWNCIPGRPNQRPTKECKRFKCQPKPCPETPFQCAVKIPCNLPPAYLQPSSRIAT